MCECVDDDPLREATLPVQWLNEVGDVVHPDSPVGRGGAGRFRHAGPVTQNSSGDLLPEPGAPAIRTMDPIDIQHADVIALADKKRNPAPVVSSDTSTSAQGMTINLLADVTGVRGITGASTELMESGSGKVNAHYDDKNICDSLTDGVSWTVDIQTRYGSGDPEGDAAYGRGTLPTDITAGNVTLGFHESCHRQDLLNYLKNTTIPQLAASVGDKKADVEKAISAYVAAWKTYFATARSNSKTQTDETGDPTLAEYKQGKRRKT